MSRTLRKQSGNRYWREAHRSKYNFNIANFWHMEREFSVKSWEEVETELRLDIINHEKKDSHYWDSISSNVKWHSNKMVRQRNRSELHKVMRNPYNYDYNRDHDLRKRGLWWVYD